MYVIELHNIMVSQPQKGGTKEALDEQNDIIIRKYILQYILMTQLKIMYARHKVMWRIECCIPATCIHWYLLTQKNCYLNKPKKHI